MLERNIRNLWSSLGSAPGYTDILQRQTAKSPVTHTLKWHLTKGFQAGTMSQHKQRTLKKKGYRQQISQALSSESCTYFTTWTALVHSTRAGTWYSFDGALFYRHLRKNHLAAERSVSCFSGDCRDLDKQGWRKGQGQFWPGRQKLIPSKQS